MSRNQFAALLAVVVIGFAAIAVVGWLSDRAAQESNRKAINQVHEDLLAANRNIVSLYGLVQDLESQGKKLTSQVEESGQATVRAVKTAGEDHVDAVTAAADDQSRAWNRRNATDMEQHQEIIRVLRDIESEVTWVPPRSFCSGLRNRQNDAVSEFNNARNVYIQQLMQDRLSTIAILSAMLQCDYLLYP